MRAIRSSRLGLIGCGVTLDPNTEISPIKIGKQQQGEGGEAKRTQEMYRYTVRADNIYGCFALLSYLPHVDDVFFSLKKET